MKKIDKECLFCNKKTLKNVQTINIEHINFLYKKYLNIDIKNEVDNITTIDYLKCKSCSFHFFDPICAGSPEFYEAIQGTMDIYYKDDRYEFLFAKEQIKPSDKVLEIGAGNGSFAELINVKEYIGLEYNEKAIEKAKDKNIKLLNKSIEEITKSHEEYFDVVCSFQVLEHVPNPKAFIDASLKTIKKGGLLIFGVPSAESILTNNLNHTLNFPPHHITRWYDDNLYKMKDVFDVTVLEVKHEPLGDKFLKRYLMNTISNKIYSLFVRKGKIIKINNLVFFIEKLVNKVVTKFKLTSNLNKKNKIGEAVIVVLKKN